MEMLFVKCILQIVTELNIFVSVVFIFLFHEINTNKYFK